MFICVHFTFCVTQPQQEAANIIFILSIKIQYHSYIHTKSEVQECDEKINNLTKYCAQCVEIHAAPSSDAQHKNGWSPTDSDPENVHMSSTDAASRTQPRRINICEESHHLTDRIQFQAHLLDDSVTLAPHHSPSV